MSSTPLWARTWWSNCKATPPAHHPGMGDHPPGRPQPPVGRPTRQPFRAPPRRPSRPPWPVPAPPGAGDGGRCPLTFICPTGRSASRGSATAPLGYESFEHRSKWCSAGRRIARPSGSWFRPTGSFPRSSATTNWIGGWGRQGRYLPWPLACHSVSSRFPAQVRGGRASPTAGSQ
jgi:hypothetical protein